MAISTCVPSIALLFAASLSFAGDPAGPAPSPPAQDKTIIVPQKDQRRSIFDRRRNQPPRTETKRIDSTETPLEVLKLADVEHSAVPVHLFTGPYKDRATQILRKPLFHRSSPQERCVCDPMIYEWLLDHPLQVAEFWKSAGVDIGTVELIDNGYLCKDGENGSCKFYTVYSSPEMRVAYCIGETKSSLVPFSLRAEMVLVQRYHFERYPDGKYRLVQQFEGFVTADGKTLTLAMKLAKHKSQEMIDASISNVQVFFSVASRAVQSYPTWAIGVIDRNKSWKKEDTDPIVKLLRTLPVPPSGIKSQPTLTIVPAPMGAYVPGNNSAQSGQRTTVR